MSAAGRSPQPSWLLPVVVGAAPLRPPEARLAAVQTTRTERGCTADGHDHPRGRWWMSGVLPAAAVDASGIAAWVGSGSAVAAAVAAAVGAATIGLAAWIWRDPLRITMSQRRRLNRAQVWRSGNDWIPPLTDSPERAQLARVQQAAARIVATRSWWQDAMSAARSSLDLVVELDEVDDQAFRLATLGRTVTGPGGGETELRARLERRVEAVVALADELESQDLLFPVVPPTVEPTGASVVGGVLDEFATRRLVDLTQQVRESGR